MKLALIIIFLVATTGCVHVISIRDYNEYSFLLVRKELYKEAEFYLLKAEKIEPENYMIKNNLAIVYEAIGDKEKSEKYYIEALKLKNKKSIRINYENFKTDSSH